MAEQTQTKQTATDRVHDALIEKGYKRFARMSVQRGTTIAFTLYDGGEVGICVQEYEDGGCEVWRPVCESISMDATIKAIPEAKR